jgi:uncharacterized protein YkwD
MKRVRMLVLLTAMAVLLLLPTASSEAGPQQTVMSKVNNWRSNHGLRSVRSSSALAGSARRYAAKMMRNGYFGHSSRIQASGSWRRLGEVLYLRYGTGAHPGDAFRAWLRSGSHRSIIAHRGFSHAGAGYVTGRFRGRKATIWVMQFGHP